MARRSRQRAKRGSLTATVQGIDDAIEAILDLKKDLGVEALTAAAVAGGEVVRQRASELAPRSEGPGHHPKGGHAADHLLVVPRPGTGEGKARVGPDKDGWYLQFAELGTRNKAANSFLRTALDETRDEARQAMIDELKRKR